LWRNVVGTNSLKTSSMGSGLLRSSPCWERRRRQWEKLRSRRALLNSNTSWGEAMAKSIVIGDRNDPGEVETTQREYKTFGMFGRNSRKKKSRVRTTARVCTPRRTHNHTHTTARRHDARPKATIPRKRNLKATDRRGF
jgi:hypothetical protein